MSSVNESRVAARAVIAAMVGGGLFLLAVPSAWALNGSCNFQARGLNLAFGALDPGVGTTVVATSTAAVAGADQVGSCKFLTMTVSADNGQNYSGGSRRLKDPVSGNFIPYALSWPASFAAPGNNTYIPFSFTGTIAGTDYVNAVAGTYSDTVVISVNP